MRQSVGQIVNVDCCHCSRLTPKTIKSNKTQTLWVYVSVEGTKDLNNWTTGVYLGPTRLSHARIFPKLQEASIKCQVSILGRPKQMYSQQAKNKNMNRKWMVGDSI